MMAGRLHIFWDNREILWDVAVYAEDPEEQEQRLKEHKKAAFKRFPGCKLKFVRAKQIRLSTAMSVRQSRHAIRKARRSTYGVV